ncbi:hypothetical protein B0T16DRAFT_457070 [Cercophora newfieldiana]|uniref:Heterokaryon incompatibility domain-containing protein n=1 Tax=Cercophora newfieldiana TaxID=92897 RepID=A0AA39YBP4_9PEZI|nr:hypothetical protein B0T16DRAFT_457070 [Cercophora newfieldiana]
MSLIPIIDLHVIAAEEFAAECFTRSKAVGGLFFAIAGSSARPILRVLALLRGETKIARTSGLGTILLSLLLTPGLAFLFGFYANPRDQYGRSTELQFLSEAAEVTISQLVPATFLLLAPSLLQFSRQADTARDPKLDIFVHAVSPIALLALFGLVLNFQLRTHSHMFSTGDEHEMLCEAGAAEDEVDDIPDRLTPLSAATTLVITTFLITVCGDFMVASLGENQATETVAGTVILPIVTGGADILRSVMAAVRGNTTLAILFSLSSALQVSVLDTPLLGIASFITKKSNPFELVFTIEEAAAITMTLIASLSILQRGKSNYIDGLMAEDLNLNFSVGPAGEQHRYPEMRFIDTESLELVESADYEQQRYAILSHRWEADEVSFDDFQVPSKRADQAGFKKIQFACEQALTDGYRLAWVDTCCIDKSSSAELSEAINSMFNWYQGAGVCYAYLSDVEDVGVRFDGSKWFERGWTLQELIAPSNVVFYSSNWEKLGEKATMTSRLDRITRINAGVLEGSKSLQSVSVAERMSWAAHRKTTRPEDIAYCLMGIFDVNMPMLYGEGSKAFVRLQEEILRNSEDQSLFAWTASEESARNSPFRGLFAASPAEFKHSQNIAPFPRLSAFQTPMTPTNRGIPLTSILSSVRPDAAESSEANNTTNASRRLFVGLNCHRLRNDTQILGIELVSRGGDQYLRTNPHKLFPCSPQGSTTTVYVAKYAASASLDPVPDAERQHAFYFHSLPPNTTVSQVLPASAAAKFTEAQYLLKIGDWVQDKAIILLETPWSLEHVCIVLWAVHVERIQTYDAVFDVVLTSKNRMDTAIAAVRRPSRLLDERIISFGAGKPYLAVALEPTVVRGFDMFMIKVEERQPRTNFERKKVARWNSNVDAAVRVQSL